MVIAFVGGGAPLAAQDIIPPKSYTTTPGGVNIADGSLVHSVTDLSIGTLSLERYHRTGTSQPNYPMFGWNFASNFDIYLSKMVEGSAFKLIAHLGNSASGTYVQSSSFIGANNGDAEKGRLTWTGSQYVYTDSSGTNYVFHATIQAEGVLWGQHSRKIERIEFAGGMVRSFSYDGSGNLKLVEDSSGYAIVFDYNANDDVTAACAFNRAETYVSASSTCTGAQIKTSYGYTYINPRYYLTSVTDILGKVTTYTNSYPGVTCIKPPGFASCQMSFTYSGPRIWTQTLLDGGTWTFYGDDPTTLKIDDAPPPYDGHNEVSFTDPDGVSTNHNFTKTSPYILRDANGNVSSFEFDGANQFDNPWVSTTDGTMLVEATYPEGDKYLAEYTGPFRSITKETHVPKGGTSPNLVKEYGYRANCTTSPATYQNCAKPISIEDPNGNVTNFDYEAHGGIKYEMSPAASLGSPGSTVTARPLKLTTWTQRYARVKNSSGTLVQAATPVWKIATETLCQTAPGSINTPTCDNSKPKTITTYEYGAATSAEALLVKSIAVTSGSETLRTCYTYDDLHRRISETAPAANLPAGDCQ